MAEAAAPAGPGFLELTAVVSYSENEALWREVASLRQKHAQQQKVVNKVRGRPAGCPGGLWGQADRASPPHSSSSSSSRWCSRTGSWG